ncbi:MAG: hypothetical protein NTW13_05935 [Candidatus Omnitrophica bacterium]|nr:hypothetical protein [Candidatus Omnitrophota bacterium]
MAAIILAVSSIHTYSHYHLITADRRARLQNELSLALEYITKDIQGANCFTVSCGPLTSSPSTGVAGEGFLKITKDNRFTQGPIPPEDVYYHHTLYNLSREGTATYTGGNILSNHILSKIAIGMQLPSNPDDIRAGMYIFLTSSGTGVEIGLVARWKPQNNPGPDNPQVSMKTQVQSQNFP